MSKVLSLRISDDLSNQLDGLTKVTKRSRSFLTNKAIEEYVSRSAWKTKELYKAVEEANKGVFVSGDAVNDWLESWGEPEEKPTPEADIFSK